MKNLLKIAVFSLLSIFVFASCNKESDIDYPDYEELLKKEQKRRDSILTVQKPILQAYALENLDQPIYDDTTGIWFEILNPPTDTSFEYVVNSNGTWVTPTATVKYKGQLLNGTVFDEPSQPTVLSIVEATQFQQGLITLWPIAFRPQKITFGAKEYHTGLITGGLKKGHKIRVISPSIYGYDNGKTDKIPANSPLDFTIEVLDIK